MAPAEPSSSAPEMHDDRLRLRLAGTCVWLTGLPAAGKTTLAGALAEALSVRGVPAVVIDGDVLRRGPCADLGFSPADRAENVRRAGVYAADVARRGAVAIAALVSPQRAARDAVRACFAPGCFVEVWLRCPVEVCAARDPKGLYAGARAGLVRELTGVDAPYEPPVAPELVLDTATSPIEACLASLLAVIAARRTGG